MAVNSGGPVQERYVELPSGQVQMKGILAVPRDAESIVLFAHGSGSGRFSPRNGYVARVLQAGGIATLLIDLLTEEEASDRALVFDIGLLTRRVLDATVWLRKEADTRDLSIGYFGAGIAGYFMRKFNYPIAPLVLGLILGPLAERNFMTTMISFHNDWTVFFTRPFSGTMMFLSILALLLPISKSVATYRSSKGKLAPREG
ncbi:MAG TPA: hypothetical protein VHS28_08805 [Chloroflexota bacterium]|nr:hypothetical protein [Chloroflexota bacterium]